MFQSRIHNQCGGWYLEYKWKCKRYDCKPNKDYCCTTIYYFFKMGHINNQTVVPTNCTYVLMKVKLQCSNIASIIGCSIEENTEKHLITATTLMQHNKTKPTTYSYVGLFLYHWKGKIIVSIIRETNPVWQLFLENFELTRLSLESHSEIYTIIHAAIVI